ncbi:MAG TPA: FecR domain-containing protein [Gemmatimonadaceae bacterium]|nr:FecR domain-containing protein [Gemmatimonadaceae bacterium]
MTDDVSAAGGYPGSGAGPAPDWEAIARYLAGESQPEESSIIEQWLEAHPHDRELVERLDAEATIDPADVDVEAALASVHARMAAAETSRPRVLSMAPARRPLWQPLSVIGLLAAAAAVGVIVTRQTRTPPDQGAQATLARTYTTGVGQRDSVRLADGSRVVLGPDSRLTVPADYGTRNRSVELRGDGYFDVVHDAAKPFAVRVGQAVVEDIGTTFSIESDDAAATSVSVVTGSVRLRQAASEPTSGVVLAAGDRGSIDEAGRASAQQHVVRDEDVAWTRGQLIFRDAPLSRVANELRRWYGVTLRVNDSALLNTPVSTSFAGEPADRVLNIIGLTLGARVQRQGDTATLIFNRRPPQSR